MNVFADLRDSTLNSFTVSREKFQKRKETNKTRKHKPMVVVPLCCRIELIGEEDP